MCYMRNVLYLILFSSAIVQISKAWNQFVDFGSCSTIYDVNQDHTYEMSWNGNDHFAGCRVSFKGTDPDQLLDEYKICIQATIWDIKDSNVKLQYYQGSDIIFTYLSKTYNKYTGDPTIQWCSDSDNYVDVSLTTSQSSLNQGRITLSITAIRTYTYYDYSGTIGGAVGAAIFVIAMVILIAVVCRRRAYAQRMTTTAYPAATPNTTIITQSGSQQMQGGIANPGYNTGPVVPPPYYPPTNQYQNYTGQPPKYPGPQSGYPHQGIQQPYPPSNPGQQK